MSKQYEWDKYFLEMARFVASKSKDNSTKCGCVIVGRNNQVLSTGYNGFPRGTEYDDPKKSERPHKYFYTEHAERNALYNACRHGIMLEGSTAYATGPPCHDCARGLIQSGIMNVVIPVKHNFHLRMTDWGDSCRTAKELFENGHVKFTEIEID